jgi:alpha-beta hydrolase superfamily lysophospholipase
MESSEFSGTEIESSLGVSRVIDILPSAPSGKFPVFLASGMGATPEVNGEIIRQLVSSGRETISVAHDRQGGHANNVDSEMKLSAELLRKAQVVNEIIDSKHMKVDAIGHSEGAMVIVIAALLKPGNFNNIVLIEPAGMVGKHSLRTLIQRQLEENKAVDARRKKDLTIGDAAQSSGKEFNRHLVQSGVRALYELISVTETEIPEMLRTVHALGIGISIIHAGNDRVFPMETFQQVASDSLRTEKKYGVNGEINSILTPQFELKFGIDGLYTVIGQHNELQFQPQKYTRAAEEALTALDKKYSDSKTPESEI